MSDFLIETSTGFLAGINDDSQLIPRGSRVDFINRIPELAKKEPTIFQSIQEGTAVPTDGSLYRVVKISDNMEVFSSSGDKDPGIRNVKDQLGKGQAMFVHAIQIMVGIVVNPTSANAPTIDEIQSILWKRIDLIPQVSNGEVHIGVGTRNVISKTTGMEMWNTTDFMSGRDGYKVLDNPFSIYPGEPIDMSLKLAGTGVPANSFLKVVFFGTLIS